MRHTISVLVENKFGVLARVAGMFSGRGFNIDSLNVGPTHDAELSRITAVLRGDDRALDLCIKQLRKLINVVEVIDFIEGAAVARELVLVKVKADSRSRPEILQIKDIFRAKIVHLSSDYMVIENTGDDEKIDAFLGLLEPYGILELARTGRLSLKREKFNQPKTQSNLSCLLKSTPTKTPTSACSKTRPWPLLATVPKVTLTR
jgi:acetolactate synthase I/III small subunit